MPRVSVVIPTHNRPRFLARAVASAAAAGTDVEVVVVDDASTDGTAAVCQAMDGIVYVRLDHNVGVAEARNVGLVASSADYVAFLDDDDVRLPGSLDVQVAALEEHPEAAFCCGAVLLADQHGRLTGTRAEPGVGGGDLFWEFLELGVPATPLAVVFRRECFLRVGLFRRPGGIDDWDMFVRMAELHPVVVVDAATGLYREPTPASGQGSSRDAAHLRAAVRQQRRLLALPRALAAPAAHRRRARRRCVNRVADTLLGYSLRRLRERAFMPAVANLAASLRLNPCRALRPRTGKALFALSARRAHGPG